jgi:hypothetical protein
MFNLFPKIVNCSQLVLGSDSLCHTPDRMGIKLSKNKSNQNQSDTNTVLFSHILITLK